MSGSSVLFLGGSGHDRVRLEPARELLLASGGPFELVEIDCPVADSFQELLDGTRGVVERIRQPNPSEAPPGQRLGA